MLFLTVFESQILIALALDAIIGDPRYRFHPVRIIGWFCSRCENFFRTLVKNVSLAGILTFSAVIVFTLALTGYILVFAAVISPVVLTLCGILLLYTTIGAGDLFNHSRAVYDALKKSDDPSPARAAVSMIVGRDTGSLDRPALIRATVETVAENMVDGITAPLFYAVLFSPVALLLDVNPIVPAVLAAMTYKAVNTMDSMFGYKNDRYLQFGRCAAKVDDAANFIPARLSGFCLVGAAWLLSMDYRSGWRLLQRDRLKHASPNGGHPEAAVAGTLGIVLGGPTSYFGRISSKPYIGDSTREPDTGDITAVNRLVLCASLIFVMVLLLVRKAIFDLTGGFL